MYGGVRQDDYKVESERKVHLAAYDQFLRKFQYGNALDAALRPVSLR